MRLEIGAPPKQWTLTKTMRLEPGAAPTQWMNATLQDCFFFVFIFVSFLFTSGMKRKFWSTHSSSCRKPAVVRENKQAREGKKTLATMDA